MFIFFFFFFWTVMIYKNKGKSISDIALFLTDWLVSPQISHLVDTISLWSRRWAEEPETRKGLVCTAPFWISKWSKTFCFVYAPTFVTQMFLIRARSRSIQINDTWRQTCGAHVFHHWHEHIYWWITEDCWIVLTNPCCCERCVKMMKTCFCCLLSASRPTSLTGTLSTTSMRTTLETFGNFQCMTIFKVLRAVYAVFKTCLQWACKGSCWL